MDEERRKHVADVVDTNMNGIGQIIGQAKGAIDPLDDEKASSIDELVAVCGIKAWVGIHTVLRTIGIPTEPCTTLCIDGLDFCLALWMDDASAHIARKDKMKQSFGMDKLAVLHSTYEMRELGEGEEDPEVLGGRHGPA